eukprot:gnl/MRDRNA2_/MRDRNA2_134222_c0_seq1.p1 gnl/MRDRNA2_/MRDRNA2_134222_c0~~gnl/MRDRNA2_/MRDRNA2_134222_c0_seq1.p1  ORF type:complete len:476 (-),score=112.21 gnl/MRDRNA2_/MRDRNA2_134222_c0_seq1:352-1707(-)
MASFLQTPRLDNVNDSLHLDKIAVDLGHGLDVTHLGDGLDVTALADELGNAARTSIVDVNQAFNFQDVNQDRQGKEARRAQRRKKSVGAAKKTQVSRQNMFHDAIKHTCGVGGPQNVQAMAIEVLGEHLPKGTSVSDSTSSSDDPLGQPKLTTSEKKKIEADILLAMRTPAKDQAEELACAIQYATMKGMPQSEPIIGTAQACLAHLSDPVHHPTRAEILMVEIPDEYDGADEGNLKQLSASGNTIVLQDAINRLLFDKDLPRKSECWAAKIWKEIDINGDNELSKAEAREFARMYLSRPALGIVLGKEVAESFSQEELDKSAHETSCSQDLHRLGSRAVADAVRDIAKDLTKISRDFWTIMDEDNSGIITAVEFRRRVRVATAESIDAPVKKRAQKIASVMLKAGAQKAKNPEESTKIIKKWKTGLKTLEAEQKLREEEERKKKEKCIVM